MLQAGGLRGRPLGSGRQAGRQAVGLLQPPSRVGPGSLDGAGASEPRSQSPAACRPVCLPACLPPATAAQKTRSGARPRPAALLSSPFLCSARLCSRPGRRVPRARPDTKPGRASGIGAARQAKPSRCSALLFLPRHGRAGLGLDGRRLQGAWSARKRDKASASKRSERSGGQRVRPRERASERASGSAHVPEQRLLLPGIGMPHTHGKDRRSRAQRRRHGLQRRV